MADPFSLPEAVVVLEIPGLKNPGFDLNKIDHHNLVLDESLDNVYTTVEHRMKERLDNKKYSLLHGSLTDEEFVRKNEKVFIFVYFNSFSNKFFSLKIKCSTQTIN